MSQPTPAPRRRPRDNPIRGALYLVDGLRLLPVKGLRAYVAVPLAVNVVLFGAGVWWAWHEVGALGAALEAWLPGWLEFLTLLLVPLFLIAALVLVFFSFALVANFIAAPFNGLLAEAVERHLRAARGEQIATTPWRWGAVLRDAGASIVSEVRKLGYFLPRALAIGLLALVPVLNLAAPLVWLVFSAWMLAISYLDYPMANHGLGFATQRRALRPWRLTSLGFGATLALGVLLPLANLVIMPAAVAGATKFWLERVAPGPQGHL